MDLLPGEYEQKALLEGLAAIIAARGFETFVAAPLLEPDPRFFPDPWEPSARGVRALAVRLLRYADQEDQDASVSLYGEALSSGTHAGAVAWFAGIEDKTCIFGVHRNQLREHDAIVGTLCHEVAHAYRAVTGLAEAHDRLEEENTDLTTVYLGFGILTTNNAFRFRKGAVNGSLRGWQRSVSRTGYLSAEALAFTLAVQVIARGVVASEIRRIRRLLELSQQEFFRAACKQLAEDVDGLRIRLGLPPKEVWPEPRALHLDPLPECVQFDPIERVPEATPAPKNKGRNVFRVRMRKTRLYAWTGLVIGLVVGSRVSEVSQVETALAGAALGAIVLGWVGSRRFIDVCSDPDCAGAPLADALTCPRCGGTIRGVIRDANERLEAEEALGPESR
jgi:hypothetical protein